MNDCPNAEIRDLLPDLLHERLDGRTHALVTAHVFGCDDCREELQLLRSLRTVIWAQAPRRIEVAGIVSALPKPPARTIKPAPRTRWADWRVAAAVTLLVAGGGSVALLNRGTGIPVEVAASAVTPSLDTPVVAGAPTQSPAGPASVVASRTAAVPAQTAVASANDAVSPAALGADGRLNDLNEQQLKALVGEIDQFEAVPITDPDPVAIPVSATTSTSREEQ